MSFPDEIYSEKEMELVRSLVKEGYRHSIEIVGSKDFISKVEESLKFLDTASYLDFVRSFIRRIIEKEGFSQLREAKLSIWANQFTVSDPIEAASLWVQKAEQIRFYLEGIVHFNGVAEEAAIRKRIAFLKDLKEKATDPEIKRICQEKITRWSESILM